MKVDALVADIGSTTTIVSAFDRLKTLQPTLIGQAVAPTTVEEGDVLRGLTEAVRTLEDSLSAGELEWELMLASSSAAGGLRMTVHGLVYDMTVKAANEAALGAGAVVKMVTAGELSTTDLGQIERIRPNIVLLAGGVDYGEKRTVLYNAQRLRDLRLDVPVIYAGNKACQNEIRDLLGPKVSIVGNVYPRIDQFNVEPTRRAIQRVFEDHIVTAPGMSRIRDMVSGKVMPTPGAVMEAAICLAEGIGDLVVVDVGGATTDVHSVTSGSEEISRILTSPEPRAKRTVEGDLGVYVNALNLVSRLGEENLDRELGFAVQDVVSGLGRIPDGERETALVTRLLKEAVAVALDRHVGRLRHLYGPTGRITVAEGKDLTRVRWIIGTGGALTRLPAGKDILDSLSSRQVPMTLWPKEAAAVMDRDYILAAAGVLSTRYPDAARKLAADSLGVDLSADPGGGRP